MILLYLSHESWENEVLLLKDGTMVLYLLLDTSSGRKAIGHVFENWS